MKPRSANAFSIRLRASSVKPALPPSAINLELDEFMIISRTISVIVGSKALTSTCLRSPPSLKI